MRIKSVVFEMEIIHHPQFIRSVAFSSSCQRNHCNIFSVLGKVPRRVAANEANGSYEILSDIYQKQTQTIQSYAILSCTLKKTILSHSVLRLQLGLATQKITHWRLLLHLTTKKTSSLRLLLDLIAKKTSRRLRASE